MRYFAIVFCVALFVSPLHATTVSFTADPAQIGVIYTGAGFLSLHSSGLNGTILSGQHLSIDALLTDDILARAFVVDPARFTVMLSIYTTANDMPGFAGSPSGFLIDADGAQFGPTKAAGGVGVSNGSFGIGLNFFTASDFNGANAVDLSGAHFDLGMPSAGYAVTDAVLTFGYGKENRLELGTIAQLPEVSSLALLPLGLIGIAVVGRFRKRKGERLIPRW